MLIDFAVRGVGTPTISHQPDYTISGSTMVQWWEMSVVAGFISNGFHSGAVHLSKQLLPWMPHLWVWQIKTSHIFQQTLLACLVLLPL